MLRNQWDFDIETWHCCAKGQTRALYRDCRFGYSQFGHLLLPLQVFRSITFKYLHDWNAEYCDAAVFDFWSGEPFFKICFWWKNPLPSTLRCPRRLLYQYSRAIWSILEVLNAIFCIFVQALLRKLEVIQKNCTKAYYLLSVFLQTDQMWRLIWSSGLVRF